MLHLAGVAETEIGKYVRYMKQQSLEELRARLTTAGLSPARFSVIQEQGSPPHAIGQAAQRTGSELVVVGASRFPMLKRLFVGSVSNEVLRTVRRDVLLVSPAAARRATSPVRDWSELAIQ
jgi:nucleotide-binding universal stress UspA family protein